MSTCTEFCGSSTSAPEDAVSASTSSSSLFSTQQQLLQGQIHTPCADCDHPESPWASINNGVLICSKCSGVHRSLGVENSFVQSVKLDVWSQHNIEVFQANRLGANDNVAVNEILEHHVPPDILKPHPQSSIQIREKYIIEKYKNRAFHSANGGRRLSPIKDTSQPSTTDLSLSSPTTDSHHYHLSSFFSPSPSSSSSSTSVLSTTKELSSAAKNNCASSSGSIEFIGILNVHLVGATNLVRSDIIGGADPYCIVGIGSQILKSKVIKKTLNPIWDEKLMFSWNGIDPLLINVLDKDMFKRDDPLGTLEFDLKPLYDAGMIVNKETAEYDLKLTNTKHGNIQLKLTLEILA